MSSALPRTHSGTNGFLKAASVVAAVFCFGIALWSLQGALATYSAGDLVDALAALPAKRLALSLIFTGIGYLVLVGYDFLGLRHIHLALGLKDLVTASFISSAFSFNLGNTMVAGAAVRYWIYSSLGFSALQVGRIVLFCSLGFWLGYLFLSATFFALGTVDLPPRSYPIGAPIRPLGAALFAVLAFYIGITANRRPFRLGRLQFTLPSLGLTLGQILVAACDLSLMAAALYALLPAPGSFPFVHFLPLFLIALVGGTVSQVPGGLGVFESAMLLLLSPHFDTRALAAALLVFRSIYFLLPLLLALGCLAYRQTPLRRQPAQPSTRAPLIAPIVPDDIDRARPIVGRSPRTYANLALRGDKHLLFSKSGRSFLMYGRMGRSWISMGDPVGLESEARELVESFRDLAKRSGGRCVFFEVGAGSRDLYARIGLSLTQVGEEARVDLQRFDLHRPGHKRLRYNCGKLVRRGYRFRVLPPEAVPAALPDLQQVSHAWLESKATREKGFSSSSFDGAYLANFPVAVVCREERIVAFANLWPGAGREELSLDLMRHLPDAPNGTMDYLFCELLLWGKAQGYQWFNFGMAPLAGLESEAEGKAHPFWQRLGIFLYRHSHRFYNFDGLRSYKDKFHPVWTPLYIASPRGLALAPVLVDVAALMAGGIRGIISKDSGPPRLLR